MKKTLLISAFGMLCFGMQTQAQTTEEQIWSAQLTGVTSQDELYLQAPVCVDNAGSTYTTGQFSQPITIGSTTLENIANSAYLAKYNADGTATWAIGLKGAATITSVTTDENNNVYIAGTFADVVVVGSTDDKTQEIKGAENETNKTASFIAVYNANGELQAVRSFLAQTNADIAASGLYFPTPGYPYITINHIEVSNGKVYASATHTGDVTFDQSSWQGSYIWGMIEMECGGIFSLNAKDLKESTSIAYIGTDTKSPESQMGLENLGFTVDNGTVYLCFVGMGKVQYDAAGKSETIELPFDGMGTNEHAYIVSSIKGDNVNTKTFHEAAHSESAAFNRIGALKVDGDNLYIGGTFFQQFAFDNQLNHEGGTDLFVAALNKDTFEPQWSAVSGLNEGDGKYFSENFTTMSVSDGAVSVYGYVLQDQDNAKKITSALNYTFADGTATSNEGSLVTGTDIKGKTKAVRSVDTESLAATLTVYGTATGIKDVPALESKRVGNTFYFDQATDVQVYDLQGRVLKQAQKVTSVNIDALQKGIYVLTDGKSSIKVQK